MNKQPMPKAEIFCELFKRGVTPMLPSLEFVTAYDGRYQFCVVVVQRKEQQSDCRYYSIRESDISDPIHAVEEMGRLIMADFGYGQPPASHGSVFDLEEEPRPLNERYPDPESRLAKGFSEYQHNTTVALAWLNWGMGRTVSPYDDPQEDDGRPYKTGPAGPWGMI